MFRSIWARKEIERDGPGIPSFSTQPLAERVTHSRLAPTPPPASPPPRHFNLDIGLARAAFRDKVSPAVWSAALAAVATPMETDPDPPAAAVLAAAAAAAAAAPGLAAPGGLLPRAGRAFDYQLLDQAAADQRYAQVSQYKYPAAVMVDKRIKLTVDQRKALNAFIKAEQMRAKRSTNFRRGLTCVASLDSSRVLV